MQYSGALKQKFFLNYQQGLLYGVTNIASQGGLVEQAKGLAQAGVGIIQYRNKSASMEEAKKDLLQIKALQEQFDFILIVNDDVALAKELDLDGVHLGQEDASVAQAREVLGPDKLIGLSTHNRAQADEAVTLEVDYIGVGPVFPSQTKPDAKEGGLEYLKYSLQAHSIPVVAIGGITMERIPELKKLGVRSVAMIQDLLDAEDPSQRIGEAIQKLQG